MIYFLFISAVLAQNACYYGANKRAGSAIIPCSSGDAIASCCQVGDLCLADSACWNPVHNVTYLYGCTDITYQDVNCPYKCGPDFENNFYVGLDYCANTTRNEWSCTHPPNDDPAVAAFPAQQCYNDSIIAFAGPVSLQPILSLPINPGGSTVYFSEVNPTSYIPVTGYTPSTTPTPTASKPTSPEMVSETSISSITSSVSTESSSIPTTTSSGPPQSSSSPSSGLSTGAKAGIGIGVGGAALAIAAVIIAWMVLRRRRPARAGKDSETDDYYSPVPELNNSSPGPSELPPNEKVAPSELPDSEFGSEAPGTPTYTSWTRPRPGQQVYEMSAENVAGNAK